MWTNKDEKDVHVSSWLDKIDYSTGVMNNPENTSVTDRTNAPFFKRTPSDTVNLKRYIDDAKQTLVRVVGEYKKMYDKPLLDQRQMVSEAN